MEPQARKDLLVKPDPPDPVETPERTEPPAPLVSPVPLDPLVSVVPPVPPAHEDSKAFLEPPVAMVPLVRTEKLVCKAHGVFPVAPASEDPEVSPESEELKVPQERLANEENPDSLVPTDLQVPPVYLDRRVTPVHPVWLVFLEVAVPSVCPERRESEVLSVSSVPKVLPVARVTKVPKVSWVPLALKANPPRRETPARPVLPEKLAPTASWANEALRVNKVFRASPDLSDPLDHPDPRDSAVSQDRRDLKETPVLWASLAPPVLKVSLASTAPRVNEVNLDSAVSPVSWDLLDAPAMLVPPDPKENLVPLVAAVLLASRELLEILVALVFQVLPVNLVLLDPRVLRVNLVLRADSVQ